MYDVKFLVWIGLGGLGRCGMCTTNCPSQALVPGPDVYAVKQL